MPFIEMEKTKGTWERLKGGNEEANLNILIMRCLTSLKCMQEVQPLTLLIFPSIVARSTAFGVRTEQILILLLAKIGAMTLSQ